MSESQHVSRARCLRVRPGLRGRRLPGPPLRADRCRLRLSELDLRPPRAGPLRPHQLQPAVRRRRLLPGERNVRSGRLRLPGRIREPDLRGRAMRQRRRLHVSRLLVLTLAGWVLRTRRLHRPLRRGRLSEQFGMQRWVLRLRPELHHDQLLRHRLQRPAGQLRGTQLLVRSDPAGSLRATELHRLLRRRGQRLPDALHLPARRLSVRSRLQAGELSRGAVRRPMPVLAILVRSRLSEIETPLFPGVHLPYFLIVVFDAAHRLNVAR
jgi:hypothetical protein